MKYGGFWDVIAVSIVAIAIGVFGYVNFTDTKVSLLSTTGFGCAVVHSANPIYDVWKEIYSDIHPELGIYSVGSYCELKDGSRLVSFSFFKKYEGEWTGVNTNNAGQSIVLFDERKNLLRETKDLFVKTLGDHGAPYIDSASNGTAIFRFGSSDGGETQSVMYELNLIDFTYKIIDNKDEYTAVQAPSPELQPCIQVNGDDKSTSGFWKKTYGDMRPDIDVQYVGSYCPLDNGARLLSFGFLNKNQNGSLLYGQSIALFDASNKIIRESRNFSTQGDGGYPGVPVIHIVGDKINVHIANSDPNASIPGNFNYAYQFNFNDFTYMIVPLTRPSALSSSISQQEIDIAFGIKEKQQGTKVFYSQDFGFGFTYASHKGTDIPLEIIDDQNDTIYLHFLNELPPVSRKSIQVFGKNPNMTLGEAVRFRFLFNKNPANCAVEARQAVQEPSSSYERVEISYVHSQDANFTTEDPCFIYYTRGYFLMNKEVPDKFLFINLGQDSIASDGTIGEVNDWSRSIKILR